MKNNKKFILAAGAAALGLVAATGATSGFAWFTTNRRVSAALSSVDVGSNAASLVIANNAGLQNKAAPDTERAGQHVDISAPEGHQLTDVSSADGKDFYTAVWGTDTTNPVGRKKVTGQGGVVSDSLYAYVDYTFYVGQKTSEANQLEVYLSKIAITVSDNNLKDGARAAIFVGGINESSAKIIVNSGTTANNKALGDNGQPSVTSAAVAATTYGDEITARPAEGTQSNRYLFPTTRTATTLTVRVWFEGTNFNNQEFPATVPTVTTSIVLAAFDPVA